MKLRDYQKKDVAKIRRLKRCALWSEQRTGKTPTVVNAVNGLTLICCPATLLYTWQREFKRWRDIDAHIITKPEDITNGATVFLINYEKLRMGKYTPLHYIKWNWFVVDESHRCKSHKSQTFRACLDVARHANNFITMTGTPARDKPEDVYTQFAMIFPKIFRSYWKFVEMWCNMDTVYTARGAVRQPNGIRDAAKKDWLKLCNSVCIRHTRSEVMEWDTPHSVYDIMLEPTAQQIKAADDLMNIFETGDVICEGVLDRVVRLRQLYIAPSLIGVEGRNPKFDWIKQYRKENPDKKILVFSNSSKFLNSAYDHITGSTPLYRRQKLVDAFQHGELQMLWLNTQACKEGLTLDNADVTIFLDVFPPCTDYTQACDRMTASTQESAGVKEVYNLMYADTYDEVLYNLVKNNLDKVDIINNFTHYTQERRKDGTSNN